MQQLVSIWFDKRKSILINYSLDQENLNSFSPDLLDEVIQTLTEISEKLEQKREEINKKEWEEFVSMEESTIEDDLTEFNEDESDQLIFKSF